MEKVNELLKEREKWLLQVKIEKEKALENAPEGTLRICSHGNRTQFYKRNNPKDFNGIYICEENRHIAQNLAQKDYDRKILSSVEKELTAIKKYFSTYPKLCAEQIYEELHKERKKLITPILESDEEYIQKWLSVSYQGKGFLKETPEYYTAKGERVRSKSEVLIAELLKQESIPYRYEYPIQLKGVGNVYPDFTVLNIKKRKEIYWEHLGMMDDSSYVESAMQKISSYVQNGIFPGDNLILTYETRKNPLSQKVIKLTIQHYLE